MTSQLCIGIIGIGRIGLGHARTVKSQPGVDRLVLADLNPENARAAAADLGAEVATIEEIFLSTDAIVIATPTSTHAELLLRAAEVGKPTFCEKPVALDIMTTRAVAQAIRRSGTPVQIGFQRRFDPGYLEVRRAVQAKELGDVRRAHLLTCDPKPPAPEFIGTSGGIFKDCGIHDIDALRWVTGGEVEEVFAFGADVGHECFAANGDSSEATAVIRMKDGLLATLHLSRYNGQGYDVRMEVAGTSGSISAGLDRHSALRSAEKEVSFPEGPSFDWFYPRFQKAYTAELAAFVEVAHGLCPVPADVDDALEALYVCEALARSRTQTRPVLVEEIRQELD